MTYPERLSRAAEQYGIENTAIVPGEHHLLIPLLQKTTANHFLAGARYALESEEVRGLVEYVRLRAERKAYVGITRMEALDIEEARVALAAFNAAKGGES